MQGKIAVELLVMLQRCLRQPAAAAQQGKPSRRKWIAPFVVLFPKKRHGGMKVHCHNLLLLLVA
ncbi:hypothetical protein [Ruegeria atlantica]|uniref:hypothetical protein n=1 Tax=Ruegeria atlantica TaxID=81569 RepID=UPI000B2D2DEA|nr:hypothetical protein [Ruegeria atlantica]